MVTLEKNSKHGRVWKCIKEAMVKEDSFPNTIRFIQVG